MGAYEALQRAVGILYGTLQQQAALLSYLDVFRVMAVVFLMIVPFVLILKKLKPGGAPIAAH